eukprot:gene7082-18642_t
MWSLSQPAAVGRAGGVGGGGWPAVDRAGDSGGTVNWEQGPAEVHVGLPKSTMRDREDTGGTCITLSSLSLGGTPLEHDLVLPLRRAPTAPQRGGAPPSVEGAGAGAG